MHHLSIFDSRDERCKQPYGAVPAGTGVKLCLRPPRNLGFTGAKCTAVFESRNNESRTIPMHWEGLELGRDLFRCELKTDDYGSGLVLLRPHRPRRQAGGAAHPPAHRL